LFVAFRAARVPAISPAEQPRCVRGASRDAVLAAHSSGSGSPDAAARTLGDARLLAGSGLPAAPTCAHRAGSAGPAPTRSAHGRV